MEEIKNKTIEFEISFLTIYKNGSITENPAQHKYIFNTDFRISFEEAATIHQIYQITKINEAGIRRMLHKTLIWGPKDE